MKRRAANNEGWALLTVLLASAVFVIMMAAVLPQAAFETRRDREADLMYRGKAYMRAIQLYYRKFRKYPAKIEDLESTNQVRFLRKKYQDPMTKSDEWRFIHVNAAGLVVDSVLVTAGSTVQPGQTGTQAPTTGLPSSTIGTIGTATSIADTTSSTTTGFSSSPTVIGAMIAGVASKSDKASILVYNSRQKYSEWEFVYNPRLDPVIAGQGLAGAPGTAQPRPGVPGAPGTTPITPINPPIGGNGQVTITPKP